MEIIWWFLNSFSDKTVVYLILWISGNGGVWESIHLHRLQSINVLSTVGQYLHKCARRSELQSSILDCISLYMSCSMLSHLWFMSYSLDIMLCRTTWRCHMQSGLPVSDIFDPLYYLYNVFFMRYVAPKHQICFIHKHNIVVILINEVSPTRILLPGLWVSVGVPREQANWPTYLRQWWPSTHT